MAHQGSIKGDGRLIIAPGDETNVYYEIHVFQPQIGPKFASGYLTGDLVAFNRAFEAGDVTLELEDGRKVPALLTSAGRTHVSIKVQGEIPDI